MSEIAVISNLSAADATPAESVARGVHTAADTGQSTSATNAGVTYSPVVRRLAQESNIDLATLQGTGGGGRVTKEDVIRAIQEKSSPPSAKAVPMSRMRKLIAEHMVRSKRTTAELTTVFEIDMTEVVRQREKAKEIFQRDHGLKLTYLPFVIAAVCNALKAFPVVNSSIEAENIVYNQHCNIGIATAVQDGLIVPVIKKAEQMNVLAISRAASDLAKRARSNGLTADDMADGSFTITNPGAFGALLGTPIINYPQVAILGLGAVEKRAVVINDSIAIRSMAYFSLTYDHRAMDGAVADAFLAHVKRTLETACPPAIE